MTDQRAWVASDGDTRCQRCGLRNPVWWADNADWNRLMPNDGVLCPTCYHKLWLDPEAFAMPWDADDDVGAWGRTA